MRFCTYCGFALTGAPSYCEGCRAPIDQALGATSPLGAPPVPPPGQGPPDLWGRQTTPGLWLQPELLSSPSSHPAPGPRARERPAGSPAAPDPFDDPFAADQSRTAAMAEFLPAVGLMGEEARPLRRTPRRPPRTTGHGVMLFAALATVASLATGGLGAWWISSHHAGLRSTSAGDRSRSPSASSPGAAGPTGAPAPTAASDTVAIGPALAGDPVGPPVAALLKAYFGAINSHDYGTYSLLFIPAIRQSQDHFTAGYRSTIDSGATLVGLTSAGAQELAATVTFTSRQDPADSPDHAACDQWNVVFTLTSTGASTGTGASAGAGAGTGYLIARSPAGYQPTVHSCG
jgi:hypothetical protein